MNVIDEKGLNGFRFHLKYSANTGAPGMTEMIVLVVAGLQDDAVAIARAKCPKPCTTALLGSGPSILQEARARGLNGGEALVL